MTQYKITVLKGFMHRLNSDEAVRRAKALLDVGAIFHIDFEEP